MTGEILISEIQERITADRKNQQILQMLIDNSRTPASKIASKLKLSKPAILQRIKNLQDKKIILQYITYFNLISAGYKLHFIFFEIDKEKETKYSEILSKSEFSAAVMQFASKFNLAWMVFSKNTEHFNNIISGITKTMKIKNIKIFPIIENYFDNYKLFDNSKKILNELKPEKIKLDQKDAKILDTLKSNSRESLVNIAKKSGLTAEAVKQRIKKLKGKGIILNFFTNFDIFKFGFHPYLILFKTNQQNQRQILEFIRKHKNTNGQYLLDNEYNLMCMLVVKELYGLKEFIDSLYKLFGQSILGYEIYLLTNQIYNDFFPKGIYKDIITSDLSQIK